MIQYAPPVAPTGERGTVKKHLLIGGLITSAMLVGIATRAGAQHPTPSVDAPPAMAAMTCSGPLVMGGPTSCKDTATWYGYAKADCAAMGYTALTILSYSTACGGGNYRFVKYQCCN